MIMRYRCAIDGKELDAIDESIYITDIRETAPKMRTESVLNAIYSGTRITRRTRQSLSVKISFAIRERDVFQRQRIMQQINAWAKEGYLTLSTRPGQRLRVIPEALPATDSALRWWDTLTMDFAAYALPYWQDQIPTSAVLSGTEGTKTVFVPGDAWEEEDVFVEADVTNKGSASMNALTLTAGDTYFRFASLNLPPGKTLNITYEDDGILRILTDGASALAKRLPESSDDLRLPIGKSGALSVSADQSVSMTYRFRGVYR